MLIHQMGAVKLLQEERVQRDDVIKRILVRSQTNDNDVKNVMEMCHLCLFHVLS